MSIRYRLLLTMVALSAIGVSVASRVAYSNGESSLQDAAVRQLAGIRRTRANQIESYFRTVRKHVQSLSEDRMFIEGMREFSAAYQKLDSVPDSEALRRRVVSYYQDVFLPEVQKFMALRKSPSDYLPVGDAAYWLQNHYVLQHGPTSEAVGLSKDANNYIRVHSKYDPPLRKLISEFGYYDLFLIELHDLRIIYSAAKNPDFGTSLRVGPYRDTPLARIVMESVSTPDPDAVFVADFTRYEPLKGAPAAFVATPIFDGPTRVGVFVMQISTAEIDRVVSGNRGWQKDGLGQTGDVEIVGPDHLMRSTSRSFLEDPRRVLEDLRRRGVSDEEIQRLRAYGTTILHTKVALSAVEEGLQGKEGTIIEADSLGRQCIVSFMPLSLPDLHWMVLAKMDLDEALAPLRKFRHAEILWSLIAVLITIAVALIMTERLLKPIEALLSAAQRMSAGDFTARVAVHSRDELGVLSSAFNKMSESIEESIKIIEDKNHENESLLLNILPGPIAKRLKSGETAIADSYSEVTVLFADIVGFTTLSAKLQPTEIVSLLNGLFTQFDAAAKRHSIEKVKTIGDAYMAVSGLPVPHSDHAKGMVEMALDMLDAVKSYALQLEMPLSIRIGINSGPAAAGVVGTTKFIYDLWGDTVNMASRMESTGMPGAIQVSNTVYEPLKLEYEFEARGAIEIKGKGWCETWLLHPRAVSPSSESIALSFSEPTPLGSSLPEHSTSTS